MRLIDRAVPGAGAALAALLYSSLSLAHAGPTDSNGGHYNPATGQYHCHAAHCRIEKRPHAQIEADTEQGFTTYDQYYSAGHPRLSEQELSTKIPGFNRADWHHWVDVDRDCQDTRAEALIAQSKIPVRFSSDERCQVRFGEFFDPYTGKTLLRADDLAIDHIVPLAHAHYAGGHLWGANKREQFANDPLNIVAVDHIQSARKSSSDPLRYLPPNKEYRCDYLSRWLRVKVKYELSINPNVLELYKGGCLSNQEVR